MPPGTEQTVISKPSPLATACRSGRGPSSLPCRGEILAFQQPAGEEPEYQPPERRADIVDGMVGKGHQEGDQGAQGKAALERHFECVLQHPEQGQPGQRGDGRRRRGEHQFRKQRRQQAEDDGQASQRYRGGILTAAFAARHEDRAGGTGQAGGDTAETRGQQRNDAAARGDRIHVSGL